MDRYTILEGNALEVLTSLPDNSVQASITSPPYYGLRDYETEKISWPMFYYVPMAGLPALFIDAWEGSLGHEPTPEMYIGHLVLIFQEVRRVLREDGLLWINIADSYAGSGKGAWDKEDKRTKEVYSPGTQAPQMKMPKTWKGIKPKNLIGIPWRLAFALQADGWYLRSDNIWHKPNCMTASVKDRTTQAHEYFFMFSKSAKYRFDQDAIREPFAESSLKGKPTRERKEGSAFVNGTKGRSKQTGGKNVMPNPLGRNRRSMWQITTRAGNWDFCTYCQTLFIGSERKAIMKYYELLENETFRTHRICPTCKENDKFESHFATYPYELVEIPVKASTVKDPLADRSIILDPFSGAGSTGVVAVRNGANYIGIEVNPIYAEISRQRIQKDGLLNLTECSQ